MKTMTITIPDMQSNHCQARVAGVLKNIPGVTVDQVQAGSANITVHEISAQEAVTMAIQQAGYMVEGISVTTPEDKMKFKTNINCSGCVAGVTPALNASVGEGNWQVNTQDPNKTLTITNTDLTEADIIDTVQKAGFKIEKA